MIFTQKICTAFAMQIHGTFTIICGSQAGSSILLQEDIFGRLGTDFLVEFRVFKHRLHVNVLAALLYAENLTRTAKFQIFFCNFETIRG